MAEWHLRSLRSPTGSEIFPNRKKRRRDRGNEFLQTKIAERAAKPIKAWGGTYKIKLLSEQTVTIADPKTKKMIKSKILTVKENDANPDYTRRNVLTKGAIITTEAGLARVTSRPGQDGVINAVLIEKKK